MKLKLYEVNINILCIRRKNNRNGFENEGCGLFKMNRVHKDNRDTLNFG